MPAFIEDPDQFSVERLKSELIANNVELPPADSKKRVYLELYLTSVKTNSPDFSSDEEDDGLVGDVENEEVSDMVDLHQLTDDQLKAMLLQYGVKAGPIVATTRALYEKKLHRLMEGPAQTSQHSVNGTAWTTQYSDSEEDIEGDEDKESETEQHLSKTASQTENSTSRMGTSSKSKDFYPQCFLPSAGWGKTRHRSASDTSKNGSLILIESPCRSFSISQMVEEIENRFSPQSKQTEIERRSGQRSDYVANGKTPQDSATDVLTELFPDTAKTPTGIYATKRRPIKGAAGRPVQFKYPEMPLLSPTTLERQEIQQRLVPLWVQILVFLLVACLLYIIYLSMEEPPSNPFTPLLDGLYEYMHTTDSAA
ncbi:LEM domain-containing protein 1 isoform X3 [Misgurnus anguillicaudatus]|uniref:LEM domain-containing protein 1 isoform X3 n=1 Tax=Misgurnus anguillicaudatus TaxID=75329 RepID=UPI003CCF4735